MRRVRSQSRARAQAERCEVGHSSRSPALKIASTMSNLPDVVPGKQLGLTRSGRRKCHIGPLHRSTPASWIGRVTDRREAEPEEPDHRRPRSGEDDASVSSVPPGALEPPARGCEGTPGATTFLSPTLEGLKASTAASLALRNADSRQHPFPKGRCFALPGATSPHSPRGCCPGRRSGYERRQDGSI